VQDGVADKVQIRSDERIVAWTRVGREFDEMLCIRRLEYIRNGHINRGGGVPISSLFTLQALCAYILPIAIKFK